MVQVSFFMAYLFTLFMSFDEVHTFNHLFFVKKYFSYCYHLIWKRFLIQKLKYCSIEVGKMSVLSYDNLFVIKLKWLFKWLFFVFGGSWLINKLVCWLINQELHKAQISEKFCIIYHLTAIKHQWKIGCKDAFATFEWLIEMMSFVYQQGYVCISIESNGSEGWEKRHFFTFHILTSYYKYGYFYNKNHVWYSSS